MKKKSVAKMKKKSPTKKPSDLLVGNRKNLPANVKKAISVAKMKKKSSAKMMKKK